MNKQTLLTLSASIALAASATAQGNNLLLTYSQPERTVSGSGGTVLQNLRPNEMHYLAFSTACSSLSAEKWLPRTAAHTMAGDENADGLYFNPGIFGSMDALLAPMNTAGVGGVNQREVFWSVSAPMGNNVSATPFRPGDVARIVRNAFGEGQVEYFITQDMIAQALGLPVGSPVDVDAIAFQPNFGVFFSIDADTPAFTACGPTLVRDGDVLCLPPWALAYTPDLRIAGVLPASVEVVYTEAMMDAFTVNATVADRFGGCVSIAIDVESLEIDLAGPVNTVPLCSGVALPVPTLVYSVETGSGASLLTTQGIGQIYNTLCGPAGTTCGFGPTWGPQLGIRQATPTTGAASHVTGLSFARACLNVLEPQQHVMNVFPAGAPAGATAIDYSSEFAFNVALIELAPPVVPWSFPAFPFSQLCFPDLYAPSLIIHAWPLPGPFGSFPMIAIPPLWTGKLLFQNIGFASSSLELSTPAIVDVQ